MFRVKDGVIYVNRKTAVALLKAFSPYTDAHIESHVDRGTFDLQPIDSNEPKSMLTHMGEDEYAIFPPK